MSFSLQGYDKSDPDYFHWTRRGCNKRCKTNPNESAERDYSTAEVNMYHLTFSYESTHFWVAPETSVVLYCTHYILKSRINTSFIIKTEPSPFLLETLLSTRFLHNITRSASRARRWKILQSVARHIQLIWWIRIQQVHSLVCGAEATSVSVNGAGHVLTGR